MAPASVTAPGVPTSADELVREGTEARLRAEKTAAGARPVDEVRLRSCVPTQSKIICIGLNYHQHAIEAGMPLTATPTMFSKFNSALAPAGAAVTLPATAEHYDHESELGVVIGTRAFGVSVEQALEHVSGYCTTNDLSARDLQNRSTQFLLGKALDGFLPVGPELVSADEVPDVQNLTVRTWLNGEIRQDGNTSRHGLHRRPDHQLHQRLLPPLSQVT
jgi:2-keto-4-pentenoate hydratase/2-oxohepta-3-ene-1,7-dioic acid hydratase in catechol pathway